MCVLLTAVGSGQEKEVALGKRLLLEVQKTSRPIASPEARKYVYSLVGRLAPHLPLPAGLTYSFELVADRDGVLDEPAALPGGILVIQARLFAAAGEEAEFVREIAHTMAHASARHGLLPSKAGVDEGFASVPLIFMAPAVPHRERRFVPLSFAQTMQEWETEADKLARQAVAAAGTDPSYTSVREAVLRELAEADPPSIHRPPTLRRRADSRVR